MFNKPAQLASYPWEFLLVFDVIEEPVIKVDSFVNVHRLLRRLPVNSHLPQGGMKTIDLGLRKIAGVQSYKRLCMRLPKRGVQPDIEEGVGRLGP